MSTNSRVGRTFTRTTQDFIDPAIERRILKVDYPDGTGPCGRVCSCNEYCKSGELDHNQTIGLRSQVHPKNDVQQLKNEVNHTYVGYFPS